MKKKEKREEFSLLFTFFSFGEERWRRYGGDLGIQREWDGLIYMKQRIQRLRGGEGKGGC